MSKRVAVLMGGWSCEREVSLVSGNAVAEALAEVGYDAAPIDVAMTAMYALDQPKAVPASSSTRMRSRDVKSFESMGLRYQT